MHSNAIKAVMFALCAHSHLCFQVMVLVYHWSTGIVEQHEPLINKPVSRWTPEEVVSWLDNLGPWAQLYREPFQQENVNGR